MIKKLLIALDWDGTITDSTETLIDVYLATSSFLKDLVHDLVVPERETIITNFGKTVNATLEGFFPTLDQATIQMGVNFFYEHLKSIDQKSPSLPFPGVLATLKELKKRGHILTIVTSRNSAMLNEIIDLLERNHGCVGLKDLFVKSWRCGDYGFTKPDKRILTSLLDDPIILEALYPDASLRPSSLKPEDLIMVGDALTDMKTASDAGIPAIAACFFPDDRRKDQMLAASSTPDWTPLCIRSFPQLLDLPMFQSDPELVEKTTFRHC